LKDGRVVEEEGNMDGAFPELKWAEKETFYDENYNELI